MANSDLEVNDAANNMENNTQKKTINCVGTLFTEIVNIIYQKIAIKIENSYLIILDNFG